MSGKLTAADLKIGPSPSSPARPSEPRVPDWLRRQRDEWLARWPDFVPLIFQERRLGDFSPAVQAYARRLLAGETWCLFLTGGVGSGKTSFAFAVAYEWFAKGKTFAFVTPGRFSENIGEYSKFQQDVKHWRYAGLLILDDVGAVRASEGRRDALLDIVSARGDDRRRTLFTSNLTIAELSGAWDAIDHKRLASRLGEGVYVDFGNNDRRKDMVNIPILHKDKQIGTATCRACEAPQERIHRDIEGETVQFRRQGGPGHWQYAESEE